MTRPSPGSVLLERGLSERHPVGHTLTQKTGDL